MLHTQDIQNTLYKEMLSHIQEDDISAYEKVDDYYYYSRTEAGKQYPIYCRKRGSLNAPEHVILDCNELAKGYPFFHIGILQK